MSTYVDSQRPAGVSAATARRVRATQLLRTALARARHELRSWFARGQLGPVDNYVTR